MMFRTTSQALRAPKPLAPHPLLARTYASNGSPPSSMGTSRSGWFRTEAEKTRALWAGALLAVIGGYWYMTREPSARQEYEKVKHGWKGTSSSDSSSANK